MLYTVLIADYNEFICNVNSIGLAHPMLLKLSSGFSVLSNKDKTVIITDSLEEGNLGHKYPQLLNTSVLSLFDNTLTPLLNFNSIGCAKPILLTLQINSL